MKYIVLILLFAIALSAYGGPEDASDYDELEGSRTKSCLESIFVWPSVADLLLLTVIWKAGAVALGRGEIHENYNALVTSLGGKPRDLISTGSQLHARCGNGLIFPSSHNLLGYETNVQPDAVGRTLSMIWRGQYPIKLKVVPESGVGLDTSRIKVPVYDPSSGEPLVWATRQELFYLRVLWDLYKIDDGWATIDQIRIRINLLQRRWKITPPSPPSSLNNLNWMATKGLIERRGYRSTLRFRAAVSPSDLVRTFEVITGYPLIIERRS